MNNYVACPLENETSMWLQNLVCGHSGLSVKVKQQIFCSASPFQKIEIFDIYRFGLTLCLGGTIVLTERDFESYHEMMVHPAMISHAAPKRVCIIGGGDGGCLGEVLKYKTVEKVVVVEIDAMVKETVEKYMPCFAQSFGDPRVEIVINDGYDYLRDTKENFDVILVDSYSPGGAVRSLETADFFGKVATAAGTNGIAVIQTDSPIIKPNMIRQTITHASAVFAHNKPYISTLASFPEGVCSFLMVSNSKESLDGFDNARLTEIAPSCKYYNQDMHVGAFLLPRNIRDVVSG